MNVNEFIAQKEIELYSTGLYKDVEPLEAITGSVYRNNLMLSVHDDDADREAFVKEVSREYLLLHHGQNFIRVQFDLTTDDLYTTTSYYYLVFE